MNKKDERIFNPVKVQKKGRWKWIVLGFVAFAVVFGAATFAYLSLKLDNFGADKIMQIFEKNSDSGYSEDFEGKEATILFMSVSSTDTQQTGQKEIYFLVLAHADMSKSTVTFCPLSVKDSYIDAYEAGSCEEVVSSIEKEYGIYIDRYVSSDENTFALAMNYMDGLEYTINERVEYRTKDLTLILTPGRQTLKGEALIKYLKYLKETDLSAQGDIFCAMARQYITPDNMENAMSIYKGVLGELSSNSNISYVDTADRLDCLAALAETDGKFAKTVSSVDELF